MITRAIKNCMMNVHGKHWEKVYWAFDIHGTILKPTFQRGVLSTEFYPHAEEAMRFITGQKDVVCILYTCSYPQEIEEYLKFFAARGIHFDYVNENPDVCAGAYGHYERKFYFNVLFEDKAGFDPMSDWEQDLALVKSYSTQNV
jgi:hypothetical protein